MPIRVFFQPLAVEADGKRTLFLPQRGRMSAKLTGEGEHRPIDFCSFRSAISLICPSVRTGAPSPAGGRTVAA